MFLNVLEHPWTFLNILEWSWKFLGNPEWSCIFLNVLEHPWTFLNIVEWSSIFLNILECSWKFLNFLGQFCLCMLRMNTACEARPNFPGVFLQENLADVYLKLWNLKTCGSRGGGSRRHELWRRADMHKVFARGGVQAPKTLCIFSKISQSPPK